MVRALEAEHLENSALRSKNSTTANGTDLDRRHCDRHAEVSAIVRRFHQRHTVRAFNVLRRVLASRKEDRRKDVRSVSVEPADAAGHRATN